MWMWIHQALILASRGLPMLTEAHLEVEMGQSFHPQLGLKKADSEKWALSCWKRALRGVDMDFLSFQQLLCTDDKWRGHPCVCGSRASPTSNDRKFEHLITWNLLATRIGLTVTSRLIKPRVMLHTYKTWQLNWLFDCSVLRDSHCFECGQKHDIQRGARIDHRELHLTVANLGYHI